jgi:hypothetical protein
VQQVGLFVDILKFGSQAVDLARPNPRLAERVLAMRRGFRERFGAGFDGKTSSFSIRSVPGFRVHRPEYRLRGFR